MSAPRDRRGFLRGLITLPLVGGGVTLIGSPTAAAVPLTHELLDSYDAWLEFERRWLQWERYGKARFYRLASPFDLGEGPVDYTPLANGGAQYHDNETAPASSRAAVVLAAVGCAWKGRSL